MRPKQKSQNELNLEVENFNLKHKVGDKVNLRMDSGDIKEVTISNPATVSGGHSAVGWFEEVSGYYLLDRVQS